MYTPTLIADREVGFEFLAGKKISCYKMFILQ